MRLSRSLALVLAAIPLLSGGAGAEPWVVLPGEEQRVGFRSKAASNFSAACSNLPFFINLTPSLYCETPGRVS